MQVTETLVDGLKREFKVVVPAAELDSRLVERLSSLKDEVRIKGFRPGKVPINHLKRLFGRSAMAEIVQDVLAEVARNTLTERGEKAAMQPDYKLPEDDAAAERGARRQCTTLPTRWPTRCCRRSNWPTSRRSASSVRRSRSWMRRSRSS